MRSWRQPERGALLFVYGSLTRDRRGCHHRLLRTARYLGPAWVTARLRRLRGYPAALPDAGGTVIGELYALHRPAQALRDLDRYEGCRSGNSALGPYRRTRVQVMRDEGMPCGAWVYWRNMIPKSRLMRNPCACAQS